MKVKYIPSSWIPIDGRRLDCGPYMSGAREAKVILARMDCSPLESLCAGKRDGMISIPVFKRVFVDGSENGLPLLGNTDILKADLSGVKHVSRQTLKQYPKAELKPNMILITSFGTVGHLAYCRKDMAGAVGSNNFMRLKIDEEIIPSGFVYAFLQSRFGMPLVLQNQSGSIVRYLLPEHIANLPVPRLGENIERQVHDLVQQAAEKRSEAIKLKDSSYRSFRVEFDLPDLSGTPQITQFATFSASSFSRRLDAPHHSPYAVVATEALASCCRHHSAIGDVARVFTPSIFKRPYVDDERYGYRYFSGTELFQHDASPRGFLNKKWKGMENYVVRENWLLMQDAGQLGGLIGRVARVPRTQDESVVSNHLMRFEPRSDVDASYLFLVLSSEYGHRAMVRHAFGTSIPQLDPKHIAEIVIPWPEEPMRESLGAPIAESWKLEDEARQCERSAVTQLEKKIEELGAD